MPKPDLQPLNIGSIAHGALLELFEIEIAKISRNIADPNAEATAVRKLTIEIRFKPEGDRRAVEVTSGAKSTLASVPRHISKAWLGKDADGNAYMLDSDPRQDLLFEPPAKEDNLLGFAKASGRE
jgi:hypothetical protein